VLQGGRTDDPRSVEERAPPAAQILEHELAFPEAEAGVPAGNRTIGEVQSAGGIATDLDAIALDRRAAERIGSGTDQEVEQCQWRTLRMWAKHRPYPNPPGANPRDCVIMMQMHHD
jgi:hypothetical protein